MPWRASLESNDGLVEHTGAIAQARRRPLSNRIRRWLDDVRSRSVSPDSSIDGDAGDRTTFPDLDYILPFPTTDSIASFDDFFSVPSSESSPVMSNDQAPPIPARRRPVSTYDSNQDAPPIPPKRPRRPSPDLVIDIPPPLMRIHPAFREGRPRTSRGEQRQSLRLKWSEESLMSEEERRRQRPRRVLSHVFRERE